jgi:hypothetical protein
VANAVIATDSSVDEAAGLKPFERIYMNITMIGRLQTIAFLSSFAKAPF